MPLTDRQKILLQKKKYIDSLIAISKRIFFHNGEIRLRRKKMRFLEAKKEEILDLLQGINESLAAIDGTSDFETIDDDNIGDWVNEELTLVPVYGYGYEDGEYGYGYEYLSYFTVLAQQ